MSNKEVIQKAMDIVNTNKDNPLIKLYCDSLHIVVEAYNNFQRKNEGNIYKTDDKYDYYIVEPTEIIELKDGYYRFRKTGYDAYACDKVTEEPRLLFCRQLCNYNLEQIKKVIDDYIKEVNNNE